MSLGRTTCSSTVLGFLLGFAVGLFGVFSQRAATAQPVPLRGIDEVVERGMKAWEVPGLALCVVHRGEIVYAKGYGVRTLGRPNPVDEDTLFAIASNSKAFTAAALGILVDRGEIGWDDRVVDHLPSFQLVDAYVTREMTIRDLLCHRSGLPRFGGDHLWIGQELSRSEILGRLRHLEMTAPFRSRFQYQNLMFFVAGEVLAAVSGQSWEEFVKAGLLDPLGMVSTLSSVRSLRDRSNVATPHEKRKGMVGPVSYDVVDSIAAAGGLISSAREVGAWMLLHLDRGQGSEGRVLSEAVVEEMQTLQTPTAVSAFSREKLGMKFAGYGLGWGLSDYRGRKLVAHGGGLSGMNSRQTLVPEEKLGVFVLTNHAPNTLTRALTLEVLDRYFEGSEASSRDWIGTYLVHRDAGEKQRRVREEKLVRERVLETKPTLSLANYAGTYANPFSGSATVSFDDSASLDESVLVFDYNPRHRGVLSHWHYDTFRVTWEDPIYDMPPSAFVSFSLDEKGQVEKLQVGFYRPIEFRKLELGEPSVNGATSSTDRVSVEGEAKAAGEKSSDPEPVRSLPPAGSEDGLKVTSLDLRLGLDVGEGLLVDLTRTSQVREIVGDSVEGRERSYEVRETLRLIDRYSELTDGGGFRGTRRYLKWEVERDGEIADPPTVGVDLDYSFVEGVANLDTGEVEFPGELFRELSSHAPSLGLWLDLPAEVNVGESFRIDLQPLAAFLFDVRGEVISRASIFEVVELKGSPEAPIAVLMGRGRMVERLNPDGERVATVERQHDLECRMEVDVFGGIIQKLVADSVFSERGSRGGSGPGVSESNLILQARIGEKVEEARRRPLLFRNVIRHFPELGLVGALPSHWVPVPGERGVRFTSTWQSEEEPCSLEVGVRLCQRESFEEEAKGFEAELGSGEGVRDFVQETVPFPFGPGSSVRFRAQGREIQCELFPLDETRLLVLRLEAGEKSFGRFVRDLLTLRRSISRRPDPSK